MKSVLDDPIAYAQRYVKLVNKARQVVPFKLNPIQKKFYKNMSGRDIILKPAQCGSSTLFLIYFLADTMLKPQTTTVLVTHEGFISEQLLERVQFFYDSIDVDAKPMMEHQAGDLKSFSRIHSSIWLGSARKFVFGRSLALNNILFSEAAFYPDPEKTILPALDRVVPGGKVIVETTPNGFGWFSEEFKNAQKGKSVFKPHFFAWWETPEYRFGIKQGLPEDQCSPLECLTEEEKNLMNKKHLIEDQIRWRRYKLVKKAICFIKNFQKIQRVVSCSPPIPFLTNIGYMNY